MNREAVAWLAVALLSISALGVSATTLESTMSTDANDVVNLDYDQVPIGQDTASNVVDEIEGRERDGESATRADPDAQNPAESTNAQSPRESGDADQRQRSQPQSQEQEQSEGGDGGLTQQDPPSLLDRLLALLTALLPSLLAIVAVLAAAGLVARYRDRLLALFEESDVDDLDAPTSAEAEGILEGSPAHTVEGAWLGMVRRLDLDQPGTMTTSECASAAVEAGFDREAVQRLTRTYEEVRYGGQPITEQREQTAVQSQRRLDAGGGA